MTECCSLPRLNQAANGVSGEWSLQHSESHQGNYYGVWGLSVAFFSFFFFPKSAGKMPQPSHTNPALRSPHPLAEGWPLPDGGDRKKSTFLFALLGCKCLDFYNWYDQLAKFCWKFEERTQELHKYLLTRQISTSRQTGLA